MLYGPKLGCVGRARSFWCFGLINAPRDPSRAQVHAGDNSRMNESSTVMAEAYKKNQQSMKHTTWTRNIHRQYARIQTNLLLLLHERWRNQMMIRKMSILHYVDAYIEDVETFG